MGDSSEAGRKLEDSGIIELAAKIILLGILVLFLMVVCVVMYHLYVKWFLYPRHEGDSTTAPARRRRRFPFPPGHQELVAATILHKGLEPSVLRSLPVTVFTQKDFKDGLECSVCLSDVTEGEKTRLLPKCSHGFHMDCIDMWFQSHSTCPLCRNPVSNQPPKMTTPPDPDSNVEGTQRVPMEEHTLNFPTNVLFWGNETQISTVGPVEEVHQGPIHQPPRSSSTAASGSSSSSASHGLEEILVVDIPRQINEEEESKSPAVPSRIRSFKRLLSRDRRVNPSSPRDFDVEQGERAQN